MTILKKNSHLLFGWLNFASKLTSAILLLLLVSKNFELSTLNVWFLFSTILTLSFSIQSGFTLTFTRFIVYNLSGVRIDDFKNIKDNSITHTEYRVNDDELFRLVGTLKVVFYILGIFFFILSSTIGSYALYSPIEQMENPNVGWISWAIVVVTSSLYVTFNIYQIYLEGLNEVKAVQKTLTFVNLIGVTVIAMFFLYLPSFILIIIVQQSLLLLNILLLKNQAHKMNGNIIQKLLKAGFDKYVFENIWQYAWKNGTTIIVANFVKHISGILVANLMPASEASSFLFVKRIFEIIDSLCLTTLSVFVPKLARLRGTSEYNSLIPLLNKIIYLVFTVYLVSYVIFILVGNKVFELVSLNIDTSNILLIILFSYAHLIGRWSATIITIGHQANVVVDHISVVFYSVVFFIVSYFLYPFIQEYSFMFGTITGVIVSSLVTHKNIYKSYNLDFFEFEKNKLFLFLLILTIINLLYYELMS